MAISKAAQAIEDEFTAYENRKNLRNAPALMMKKGQTIKGQVVKLNMNDTEFGSYPVVTYRVLYSTAPEVEVGTNVAFHAFHTIARERLAELKTDLDTVQWLSYDGTKESRKRKDKDGNPVEYHTYDVENDGVEETAGKAENFSF